MVWISWNEKMTYECMLLMNDTQDVSYWPTLSNGKSPILEMHAEPIGVIWLRNVYRTESCGKQEASQNAVQW